MGGAKAQLRAWGKGTVQQQAIEELVNLPQNNPLKSVILEVLYSLQKNLEVKQNKQLEDRELMMQLAPLYQEDRARAIQEGFQRGKSEGIKDGELNVTLRLLTRKLGNLSPEIMTQIQQLNLEQLEALTEALLDFNTLDDLNNWLQ